MGDQRGVGVSKIWLDDMNGGKGESVRSTLKNMVDSFIIIKWTNLTKIGADEYWVGHNITLPCLYIFYYIH